MYGLNLNTGISQLLNPALINIPYNQNLNAFGYNPVDNYIWGYRVNTNQIVRVASDYSVDTFAIAGLPIKAYNTGDISENGVLYLYAASSNDSVFYRINLNLPYPQLLLPNLTIIPTSLSDWAISPIDNNIYSISNNVFNVYRFDTLGNRTFLGQATGGGINAGGNYGAIFMDSSGSMYASNNQTGKIFKIAQPQNGDTTAILFSQGPASLVASDGAACPGITFTPVAVFNATNHICPGTCTNFTNLSQYATSYEWAFAGANTSSSTDVDPQNICYNTPGTYSVSLIATNANGSDTLMLYNYITVYPYPAPQGITQSGDTLFANAGVVSYQWYNDGIVIAGATDYFYVATQSGDFNVVATDANNCEVEAVIYDVIASVESIKNKEENILLPNPFTNSILVKAVDDNQSQIIIYDMLSRKLLQKTFTGSTTLNTEQLAKGIYIYEVRNKNGVTQDGKVVKE